MVTWTVIHNVLVAVVDIVQAKIRRSSVASITIVQMPAQGILVICVVRVIVTQV